MKCLPCNKLSLAQGNVLHDWHAEVLAIRAFNRFLLDECYSTLTPPFPHSEWIRRSLPGEFSTANFTIREDVTIHMYCSEAPCGDASMELTMDAQEDATPWTSSPPLISSITHENHSDNDTAPSALRGRSNFNLLGAVRCKPSRPDAPPTLSKSCTDKLALKQATSLLSSLTSTIIAPQKAYLHSLILPSSQYVPAACERAFSRSGRFKALPESNLSSWGDGYTWTPFKVKTTNREFPWSRRSVGPAEKAIASNLSAVWTPQWQETLIGGVLQGRKQFDARGASSICRRSMWRAALQASVVLGVPALTEVLGEKRYKDVKESDSLHARKKVKQDIRDILDGWVLNRGDEDFALGD